MGIKDKGGEKEGKKEFKSVSTFQVKGKEDEARRKEGGEQWHEIKCTITEQLNGKRWEAVRKEMEGGKCVLPSTSNCVSTPDGPGTEQTSLALRKVVQRLIRLLFPPTSFWMEVEERESCNEHI